MFGLASIATSFVPTFETGIATRILEQPAVEYLASQAMSGDLGEKAAPKASPNDWKLSSPASLTGGRSAPNARREHLAELHRRITETDQRLGRLFDAIEAGMMDKDDAMTKERMVSLKALRDQAAADAERTQLALESSGNQRHPRYAQTSFLARKFGSSALPAGRRMLSDVRDTEHGRLWLWDYLFSRHGHRGWRPSSSSDEGASLSASHARCLKHSDIDFDRLPRVDRLAPR